MIIKFHDVNAQLPVTYHVIDMQISLIVPVVLKDESRFYASLWGGVWRESFSGEKLKNVTHWGEVIEE